MSVVLIIDDYAYRLLNDGQVEHTVTAKMKDGLVVFDPGNFSLYGHGPEERHMDGNDDNIIRQVLKELYSYFPPDRLPSQTPSTQNKSISQDPLAPAGEHDRRS